MKQQLNEIRRFKQLAGIIKESVQQNDQFYQELVDEIVNKAGRKSAEYDFTKEVLREKGLYKNDSVVLGLYDFAKGANYHRIADACKDILNHNKDFGN